MQKNITGNQNNVSEFLAQWGSFCSDSEASFSAEYEFIYYLKGMKAFLIPYCNGNLRIQKIVERINTILKELEQ